MLAGFGEAGVLTVVAPTPGALGRWAAARWEHGIGVARVRCGSL